MNDPVFGAELLEEGTVRAELLVNEMLARFVAGNVRILASGTTMPPVSPALFDSYLVGGSATGAWSGKDGNIAFYVDGWKFITPAAGLSVFVVDTKLSILYDGTTWIGVAASGMQTLTDAATVAWNAAAGRAAQVTLGGNRTLAAPTNVVNGQTYVLHVIQDGTGTRLLTWNAVFKWPGGTAPTLTATAGKIDVFTFQARGGNLYAATHGLNY